MAKGPRLAWVVEGRDGQINSSREVDQPVKLSRLLTEPANQAHLFSPLYSHQEYQNDD